MQNVVCLSPQSHPWSVPAPCNPKQDKPSRKWMVAVHWKNATNMFWCTWVQRCTKWSAKLMLSWYGKACQLLNIIFSYAYAGLKYNNICQKIEAFGKERKMWLDMSKEALTAIENEFYCYSRALKLQRLTEWVDKKYSFKIKSHIIIIILFFANILSYWIWYLQHISKKSGKVEKCPWIQNRCVTQFDLNEASWKTRLFTRKAWAYSPTV